MWAVETVDRLCVIVLLERYKIREHNSTWISQAQDWWATGNVVTIDFTCLTPFRLSSSDRFCHLSGDCECATSDAVKKMSLPPVNPYLPSDTMHILTEEVKEGQGETSTFMFILFKHNTHFFHLLHFAELASTV